MVGDNERFVVFGFEQLIVGENVGGSVAIGELTLGQIGVLQTQHRAHIFKAETKAVQLSRVHIHTHRRKRAAADVHLADSLNLKQSLLNDCRCRIVKFCPIVDAGSKNEDHDRRVGGIDFAVGGVVGKICRQIGASSVDRGLNVARRAVNVAVQIKLQSDRG